MAYDFELSDVLPATPLEVYEAWMSSAGHTAMTGSEATVDPRPGGAFQAGDGYIWGRTVSLDPGRRIVQTWRTSEFEESYPDSEIEVVLEPVEGGTKLTLHHRNVPDGQTGYEEGGWQENYFDPMREYFAAR
jgi:activator of HSP90 ATPase